MLAPRPYQLKIINDARGAIAAGHRRVCIVAPTGSGKTIVAALIIGGAAEKGRSALLLAHRRELIRQSSAKLHEAGVDHGIWLPGYTPRPGEPVQVASIPTLQCAPRTSRGRSNGSHAPSNRRGPSGAAASGGSCWRAAGSPEHRGKQNPLSGWRPSP
jgi:Rad3-related DNA helicase